MKKFIFFLLLLISFSAFAQEKKDTSTVSNVGSHIKWKIVKEIPPKPIIKRDSIKRYNESKWSMGASVTPNYSYVTGLNRWEKGNGLFRCNYELLLNYRINKHFQFITGIALNQYGFYIKSNMFPPSSSIYDKDYTYYESIRIPVQCRYNFFSKPKYLLFTDLGIELSYYLQETDSSYYSWNNKWTSVTFYRFNVSPSFIMPFATAGIGIENKIFKHLYSSISIGFEYSLVPIIYQTYNSQMPGLTYYNIYSCFLKAGIKSNF
jgi:hypothetical protein